MAKSYLANTHTRNIMAENVIFHNLYMSKYVQSKKKARPAKLLQTKTANDLKTGLKIFAS